MKTKPSDITKQSEGAGGIKWAKDVFEQEIKPNVATKPIDMIKLVRKIWTSGFGEGQRYREAQIIEYLEERLKGKSPEFFGPPGTKSNPEICEGVFPLSY